MFEKSRENWWSIFDASTIIFEEYCYMRDRGNDSLKFLYGSNSGSRINLFLFLFLDDKLRWVNNIAE